MMLTYPQCGITAETALNRAIALFAPKEPKLIVACSEKHADGTPHIHVVVQLGKKPNYTTSAFADPIGGKHGDYRPIKGRDGLLKSVKYLMKDGDFVFHGVPDLAAWIEDRKAKKGTLHQIAAMAKAGKTLRDIDAAFPSSVMLHQDKIRKYIEFQKSVAQEAEKEEWKDPEIELGWSDAARKVANWLRLAAAGPLPYGQQHLFLHGPTGVGKTSLIMWLSRFFAVYHVPMGEAFYDFLSSSHQILVLDEFKAQKTITWMNSLLGGSPMTLRKKGSQFLKTKNTPTIVLSNYTLRECYHQVTDAKFETISRRLLQVHVAGWLPFVPRP